jgi:hypothetical protein
MKKKLMNSGYIWLASLLVGLAGLHSAANAQDELRGSFRLSRTTLEIGGVEMSQGLKDAFAVDEEVQWQVYVPENYDRNRPAGVFVFVDPAGWGGMPDPYRPVFDGLNMIWIGANGIGAGISGRKALWMTILGERAIQQDYAIDLDRLYVGSTGAGALTAVHAVLATSEFAGVIHISGSIPLSDVSADFLDTLKRKPIVFMTSNNDKANRSVRASYDSYKKAGFDNIKLIYDLDGSRDVAKPELVDEAIRYLDSRLN